MAQKFRVQEIKVKSGLSNRSGIITENMTSSTPDKLVGSTFKTVLVNEFGEQVVGPESGPTTTAPIMGGAGTSIVTNITANGAKLTGTYTSDGGSPITATGLVVYPSGNASTVIGGADVLQFTDATLSSPVTATATGLIAGTSYCMKPYAINAIGTSYGDEECFSTLVPIAYVANLTSNNVSVTNLVTNTISANIGVGFKSVDAIFVPSNNRVYVTSNDTNNVGMIDSTTNTFIGNISIGHIQHDISYNPAGFLYVVGQAASYTMKKIDISTNTVVASVGVGSSPIGVQYHNGFVYTGNISSNTVSVIDDTTNTVIATISTNTQPCRMNIIGNKLYVACNSGSVAIIDTITNTLITHVTTGGGSNGVGVSVAQNKVYIANSTGNNVSIINNSTNTLIANVAVGTGPSNVDVLGDIAYVSNRNSNSVSRISTLTDTVVGTITGFSQPYSIVTNS